MKLLIGGSPCTHWSIAQKNRRETEPSGIGWELFKNYKIAMEKYEPDFFLYENNKSMAPAIREQITKDLGVEPIMINSALVSAQSRQRLYWTNIPGVEQPEDRGVLLRDILESGIVWREKAYTLRAAHGPHGGPSSVIKTIKEPGKFSFNGVAEPIRIGTIESNAKNADFDSQQYRVYSTDGKAVTLCGQGGGVGAKTGLYAVPVSKPVCINGLQSGKSRTVDAHMAKLEGCLVQRINNPNHAKQQYDCIVQPICVGNMPSANVEIGGSQSGHIHSIDDKSVPIQERPNSGGADGTAAGLYTIPAGIAWRGRGDSSSYEMRGDQKSNAVTADGHQSRLVIEDVAIFNNPHGFNKGGIKYDKAPTLTANGDWQHNNFVIEAADGKTYPVYAVTDGQITIKGKRYPIKLADGFYIIRKLTVTECKRLQTVPEEYTFPVSDTQACKMLGNGWTVEVIAHILGHIQGITTEPLEVLSMYDGMSCGHIALDRLGANVTKYYATEIDKYAVQTTMANYPDTIQLGDAFNVRRDDWGLPKEGET